MVVVIVVVVAVIVLAGVAGVADGDLEKDLLQTTLTPRRRGTNDKCRL